MGMLRNRVSGLRTAVVLAVAGASLTGGIVSYSIAVASPTVSPEVRSITSPEGQEAPCEISGPDLDWYRRRGDQMQSGEMLPDTVSFNGSGATLQRASTRPAGANPCGGGGGGGGGGTSCLSEFGFNPENYWVVLDFTNDVTIVNMYVATNGSFTTLASDAIPTATACSVTYQWVVGEFPLDLLFGGYPFNGAEQVTDLTAMQVTVSGLSNDGMGGSNLYGMFVCGDSIGLRVSDGTNSYIITGPPCSDYRFESELIGDGAFLKYDYQDPWGRPESITTNVNTLGSVTSDAWLPIVKPQSPLTITFGTAGFYTVKTGDDTAVNCADPSVNNTQLNNANKSANDTWADPSPANKRIYCTTDQLP